MYNIIKFERKGMKYMNDRRKVLELFEAQSEYMNDRVSSGIEMYRKGYAEITVKDADGNVIPDAKIKAVQKSHEFKFGANLFMLDELETPEKNKAYKKTFAELFNINLLEKLFYGFCTHSGTEAVTVFFTVTLIFSVG